MLHQRKSAVNTIAASKTHASRNGLRSLGSSLMICGA
jgi:hypothetical protein